MKSLSILLSILSLLLSSSLSFSETFLFIAASLFIELSIISFNILLLSTLVFSAFAIYIDNQVQDIYLVDSLLSITSYSKYQDSLCNKVAKSNYVSTSSKQRIMLQSIARLSHKKILSYLLIISSRNRLLCLTSQRTIIILHFRFSLTFLSIQ